MNSIKEVNKNENYELFIKDVLKIKNKLYLKNLHFIGIEYLKQITEYNFTMLKYEAIDRNGKCKEIYLKNVHPGKIKESIYCFLKIVGEEGKPAKNKEFSVNESADNKIKITQTNYDNGMFDIRVTTNFNDEIVDINLIEAENINERWENEFNINKNDLILLGIRTK